MKKWIGYNRGMNLGGWLSQCCHTKEHYDSFIREEDVCKISEWGFDHIRVPVDYNLLENEDGSYRPEGFVYIQKVIDWCGRYDLNMILDLHKTAGYSFDAGEKEEGFFTNENYQERFYKLWEEFARRYGRYEHRLAFELLNEVVDKELSDTWNKIASECIARIRKIVPTISILVGGYWNNCAAAVKDLPMPQDKNIIYNFHCYEPLVFTHQGAGWVAGMKPDFRFAMASSYQEVIDATEEILPHQSDIFPKNLPMDQPLDERFFIEFFAEAAKVAEERGTALYCGEYGVIDRADIKDAALWMRAINKAFDYYGIGRAVWSYKEMDYEVKEEVRRELL